MFIRASINHIIKSEFFIAYLAAHNTIFTEKNIKGAFRGAGISPWDPDSVISKLDIRLCTPTPSDHSISGREWESQTPKTERQMLSQFIFIKNRIHSHRGSSFIHILDSIDQLAKGAQAMAYKLLIIRDEVRIL